MFDRHGHAHNFLLESMQLAQRASDLVAYASDKYFFNISKLASSTLYILALMTFYNLYNKDME
jgi:hypothetical protein